MTRTQTMRRTKQRLQKRTELSQGRQLLTDALPTLPLADRHGHYPATSTLRVLLARQIIERRRAAKLSQAQLAKLAGVRQETISRLETGKHAPNIDTVDRIDKALKRVGV